jgi:holin-like protein
MIAAIAGLLGCQLLGEILVRALLLPVPGPVAGLGLMFGFLVWRGWRDPDAAIPVDLGRVTDAFLRNLSLLFIPASVGVVQYLGLLQHYAVGIAVAIALSTILTLILTAVTFRLVSRLHTVRRKAFAADIESAVDPEHHP